MVISYVGLSSAFPVVGAGHGTGRHTCAIAKLPFNYLRVFSITRKRNVQFGAISNQNVLTLLMSNGKRKLQIHSKERSDLLNGNSKDLNFQKNIYQALTCFWDKNPHFLLVHLVHVYFIKGLKSEINCFE